MRAPLFILSVIVSASVTLASFAGRPEAVAAAEAAREPAVTYIASKDVAAAFGKGAVLLDAGEYMVHASRRDAAGQAEIHAKDTDIIYVLDGSATFVTGGSVPDGKTTAPDEIRGAAIVGGETRRLVKGDFIVVPNGTPHWFKEVEAPFTYYVVKVR